MSKITTITPLIISYNEEKNIKKTIAALKVFKKIILFDQYSSDNTTNIAKRFKNLKVIQVTKEEITKKYNKILNNNFIKTDWVILLSADHVLTKAFIDEIKTLNFNDITSCEYKFDYIIYKKKIKSIYPPVNYFFNRRFYKFFNKGHSVEIKSKIKNFAHKEYKFKNRILHDDKKKIDFFINPQLNYAKQQLFFFQKNKKKRYIDKLRFNFVIIPFFIFFYCYFIKLIFLDGKRGIFYCYQRLLYEIIFQLNKMDSQFKK